MNIVTVFLLSDYITHNYILEILNIEINSSIFVLGQIDWAALAQAWIAQREASGQQGVVEQQGMMPNGQEISGVESGANNHNNFQGDPNFNRMWQPGLFSSFLQ